MIGVIALDAAFFVVVTAIWSVTYYLGSFLLTMLYILL
jgi:hypothetical protein